jgi:alanine racemase
MEGPRLGAVDLPRRRAEASIDLGAIRHNVGVIGGRLAAARPAGGEPLLCAVVKADGYGHGAVAVAAAALQAGADRLAVATAGEAAELRVGGIVAPILVLGPLTKAEVELALGAKAEVVVWSEGFVDSLPDHARAHVKLDTGMGRFGAGSVAAADRLVDAAGGRLAGVMTHFATADELGDGGFFEHQLRTFAGWADRVKAGRPRIIRHAANSAAVWRDAASHLDMCRCGIATYGIDPFHEDGARRGLRPALTLASHVAALHECAAGASVGYGRRFVAPVATRIATVPIGYADGFSRALGGRWQALVRGRPFPLVGTVSMDAVTLAVPAGAEVEIGDKAILLGEDLTAEKMAADLGTIAYEVTARIGPRVPRVAVG